MIFLLQLLKTIEKKRIDDFYNLFSDLDHELDDLGYRGHESQLISEMLFNHFSIEMLDQWQLEKVTEVILDKRKFKLTIDAFKTGLI